MGVFSIKPARKESAKEADLICDLDAIIETTSKVRLNGKDHILQPITTENFFKFMQAYADIAKLKDSPPEDVRKMYTTLVNTICPSITLEHVKNMTHMQCLTLVEGLANKVLGRVNEKKKTLVQPTNT